MEERQQRSQELATSSTDRQSPKAKPSSIFLGFLTVWVFRDLLDQSVTALLPTVARCLSTSRERVPSHSHGPMRRPMRLANFSTNFTPWLRSGHLRRTHTGVRGLCQKWPGRDQSLVMVT